MTAYDDLGEQEQVALLREVAATAAPAFGLDPTEVELVAHVFNTTFALTGPQGRVALRVNTNSQSTVEHVGAQHAWIRALAAAGVVVAIPLRTRDGAECVEVPLPERGGSVLVTAAGWLDGPDLGSFDGTSVRQLGELTARMHSVATEFVVPGGAVLPVFDEPLFGDENVLESWDGLTGEGAEVVGEAFARSRASFAEVFAGAELVPCHADLHAGNLKATGGGLAVFDFDDMGLTLPVLDLAISTFYLDDPSHESMLREGYAAVRPVPVVTPAQFQGLVAGRQLLLTNSLLRTSTASLRAMADDYVGVSVDRFRHWLEKGRFTRQLPAPGS